MSLLSIEVKRLIMFCKLYGVCNFIGEIIIIEIVWFIIIDMLKIYNGRIVWDEFCICV